ncbi:A/G-specific adenine glycosylase [Bathymodiolus japonicus methanotrophic gill symbiont]|uniref:A/G-specific adenine glycosylase n=1 Tax=Bathymodiolus japonicus methanotrophic gill symbiont TaxID=113269 RepID=UPI001B46DE37|nr:A/G-specific adenine glycosylase [Bathymodiolus japonicus methanotrophic gill symbiont]GFO71873.1 A/G-specific adenine glycosylase [Bathymodiolus japonicus methanotrophic gill symbiont]
MNPHTFSQYLLTWFDQFGRKDLPWQHPVTAYRVWISEIMLQQTQVVTVIPYFNKFVRQYPDIQVLANAPLDEVLSLWAGLGYYTRARNLHKTAGIINQAGRFPDSFAGLVVLPGIGASTAGAILSIVFNKRQAILDGNVRRVLARFQAISGWTGGTQVNKLLWSISAQYTPEIRVADYTQAIMDLGATICTRAKPRCTVCPLQTDCLALEQQRVAELPTPKPRKQIPIKQSTFIIAINEDQQILLEKRAPTGIWGGLWSVPELAHHSEVEEWLLKQAMVVTNKQELAVRRHTFSHYHLDYQPIVLNISQTKNNILEAETALWYKHRQTKNIALPAPVKQLFDELNKD